MMTVEEIGRYITGLDKSYEVMNENISVRHKFKVETVNVNIMKNLCAQYNAGRMHKEHVEFYNGKSWKIEDFVKMKERANVPEDAELYLEFDRDGGYDPTDKTEFRWYRPFDGLEDFFETENYILVQLVNNMRYDHQKAIDFIIKNK